MVSGLPDGAFVLGERRTIGGGDVEVAVIFRVEGVIADECPLLQKALEVASGPACRSARAS